MAYLTDLDDLPDPDILANEIIEKIESGLGSFKEIIESIAESKEPKCKNPPYSYK